MDVYFATSMRAEEDFYAINRFTKEIFKTSEIDWIDKVSFFDPTQSYHDDRIAKGIVEGLMLRRAAATVFLAQETDTLGKASELASTLAQGKLVIAYVSRIDDVAEAAQQIRLDLEATVNDIPDLEDVEGALSSRLNDQMLKNFPEEYVESPFIGGISAGAEFDEAIQLFAEWLADHYDSRARTYQHKHPLGVQVDISSGVPNGILVVRSAETCRELLAEALLHQLEFRIEAREGPADEPRADLEAPLDLDRLLREERSASVHRVVVGDSLISNAYWNWYGSD